MPYADPEEQKQYQREWQRKQNSKKVKTEKKFLNPTPATAQELLIVLTGALNDIQNMKTDPIIKGRAIAYLVNVALRGVEVSDLESRLKALERSIRGGCQH